ncbi:hypothetical protein LMG19144_03024 [Xanthomonas arboricola pv. fragariae]|nr:hypothetical protein LMG19144_03024 [Xanthomonas arboricola pv. fragariae]
MPQRICDLKDVTNPVALPAYRATSRFVTRAEIAVCLDIAHICTRPVYRENQTDLRTIDCVDFFTVACAPLTDASRCICRASTHVGNSCRHSGVDLAAGGLQTADVVSPFRFRFDCISSVKNSSFKRFTDSRVPDSIHSSLLRRAYRINLLLKQTIGIEAGLCFVTLKIHRRRDVTIRIVYNGLVRLIALRAARQTRACKAYCASRSINKLQVATHT